MNFMTPPPEAARAGIRAMKQLASADGALGPASRQLLEATQRHLLRQHFDLDALEPIAPEALAQALPEGLRRQFAQGMAVVSLTEGKPSAAKVGLLRQFGTALGVQSPELEVIYGLIDHHMALFKLDFLRRSHIADMVKQQLHHEGFLGTLKGLASFRGVYEDAALSARFRATEHMPAGSFGRALFDYIDRNHFSFPGEKFGFPLHGFYHDLSHVLSGYATDSAGEVQIGGFIGGFKKENPFFVILFVMMTFGAGVNVTPLEQPLVEGILAQEGLADRFFEAVQRGSAMKVDISDSWDFWPLLPRPLDEVRAALGVPPSVL
jgi:hypothetical protein